MAENVTMIGNMLYILLEVLLIFNYLENCNSYVTGNV